MAARKNLLLMAVLLLSAVAVHSVAAAAGGGEVGGEGYADPVAAGGYALCRPGCPDAFWDCNDWCSKNGYKNGGVCVPPLRQQCCCYGASV
ncbi:hypothetical protein PAHAL_8G246900 [Panicum hallii]|uniref:Knottin scorpion toxin-like domain-containing protein n=1 Tax=Panicum hallii TaxID=206008 RepID=A0A2S3IFP3_9POAL|nr:hypothetical protein PAHAL_8G246900 [Panicum hallii]